MSTPIKRLEIIKNAIELEDDDIIFSQLARLKNEAFGDELQAIVVALEQRITPPPSRLSPPGYKASGRSPSGAIRRWRPASWS
jgi:hypothetical protein